MAATSTVANASTTPMRVEIQPKMRCFIAIPEKPKPSSLPSEAGEVSPSNGDGGVESGARREHDPSARSAGTSPRRTRAGKEERQTTPSFNPGLTDRLP